MPITYHLSLKKYCNASPNVSTLILPIFCLIIYTLTHLSLATQNQYKLEVNPQDPSALTIVPSHQRKRWVDGLHSWLEAWNVYLQTVLHYFPLLAPDLLAYQDQICKFSRKFRASAWIMYDTTFRYMTASNPSLPWGKINDQLYNDILKEEKLPFCISCHSYGHRTISCSARSQVNQSFRRSPAHAQPFTTSSISSQQPHLNHPSPLHRPPSQPLCLTSSAMISTVASTASFSTSAATKAAAAPIPLPSALKESNNGPFSLSHLSPSTPVCIPKLAQELMNHPDRQFASDLFHDLQFGCCIGYQGPHQHRITPNLKSTLLHPDAVTEALSNEVSQGHTVGPFSSLPLPTLQCSPLGLVPKKDGSWRIIMDLSSSRGSSINDFISKEDYTLHYATFDQALALVSSFGTGALMAKLDLKHAFCLCPVSPSDWDLLGMHWQGKFYVDLCLPFGLRSSPFLFKRLADAFEWMLKHNYAISALVHYLDDYFTVGPPSSPLCGSQVNTMVETADRLGIPLAPDKLEGPTSHLVFLGIPKALD